MTKPLFPPMPPLTEEEVSRAERQNRRRHQTVVELVVLLTVSAGGYMTISYLDQLPFNAAQWKGEGKYKSHEIAIRKRMYNNLIRSRKLLGLRRAEVVALLGKPDTEYDAKGWQMKYNAGVSLPRSVTLVIKFDNQKQVVDCHAEGHGFD